MTKKTERPEITLETLKDVLPVITLSGVDVFELRVRKRDGSFEPESLPEPSGEGDNGMWQMRLLCVDNEDRIIVRGVGVASVDSMVVDVDMGVWFDKSARFALPQEMTGDFVERIGTMALFPYIRSAVHDMSSRVGTPIALDLLRAGHFSVNETSTE